MAAKKKAKKKPRKPPKKRPKKKPVRRLKRRPSKVRPRKTKQAAAAQGCSLKIVIFRREDLPGQPYFVDTQTAEPSVGKGDKVFWFNSTGQNFTLTFNGDASQWPFDGAKQDIFVPAYGNSTVFFAKKKGPFSYHGDPHLDGPPADPVVDAGD